MRDVNLSQIHPDFYPINTSPAKFIYPDIGQFAINALVIANQSSWADEFSGLMEQVHNLSLMPNDMKCILAMFETRGFIRQTRSKTRFTIADAVNYMNDHCADGQIAIIKTKQTQKFAAIVPKTYTDKYDITYNDDKTYLACGLLCAPDSPVVDIWIRWADGLDHSPVKRRKQSSRKADAFVPPADHDEFHYLQKNPRESTGDCVIRGIAAVLDISWDEAMDRLVAATGHVETTVNCPFLYRKLLKEEGMKHYPVVWRNGNWITGKEFCHMLDKQFFCGQRVFAQLGYTHVGAIIPFQENKRTRYKIVDCFDSSDALVGDYWVKEALDRKLNIPISEGDYVTHPLYGRGKVQHVHANWIAITFPKGSFHVLDAHWIMENCKIENAV